MKVTYRIPSKAIQYGFIEVVDEMPDGTTPEMLGRLYVNAVHSFLESEQKGLSALLAPSDDELAPKVEVEPGDPEAAAQRLAEGKKPRTVGEADEMVRQVVDAVGKAEADDSDTPYIKLLKEELGATVVEEFDAQDPEGPGEEPTKPWEQDVKAKAKPWEAAKKAAPQAAVKVASIDW